MALTEQLDQLWEATTGFDYVDRFVVSFFLRLNFIVAVFVISENITAAEAAELAPAFNTLSYVLLLFIVWPLVRVLLPRVGRWFHGRYYAEGEQA